MTGHKEHLTEYVTIEDYKELVAGSDYRINVFKELNRKIIKAPLNIRNIYYIVNEPGTQTSLKISNFTSINPDCPVIKHKLVVSK